MAELQWQEIDWGLWRSNSNWTLEEMVGPPGVRLAFQLRFSYDDYGNRAEGFALAQKFEDALSAAKRPEAQRCEATFMDIFGVVVQCIGVTGHDDVHVFRVDGGRTSE